MSGGVELRFEVSQRLARRTTGFASHASRSKGIEPESRSGHSREEAGWGHFGGRHHVAENLMD